MSYRLGVCCRCSGQQQLLERPSEARQFVALRGPRYWRGCSAVEALAEVVVGLEQADSGDRHESVKDQHLLVQVGSRPGFRGDATGG